MPNTAVTLDFVLLAPWVADNLELPSGIQAPEINPGPPSYEGVADTINEAIVLTIGGGPGLELEDVFDRTFVTVDIAGPQNDSDGATALALAVDRLFLSICRPRTISGVRVLAVRRAGGRPTPIGVDDGDRTHLACSYVWRVQSGVQ